jgi:hypothetical protein
VSAPFAFVSLAVDTSTPLPRTEAIATVMGQLAEAVGSSAYTVGKLGHPSDTKSAALRELVALRYRIEALRQMADDLEGEITGVQP